MKIAIVHSFYQKAAPSGENRVVELQTEALSRAGHDVILLARRTDDLSTDPLYPLKSSWNVAAGRGWSPLSEIDSFDPDVVHVHNLFPNIGAHWLGRTRAPIVATLHNFRPVCASGFLSRSGGMCTECLDHGSQRSVRYGCYRGSPLATIPLAISTRKRGARNGVLRDASSIVCLSEWAKSLYSRVVGDGSRLHVVPNFAPAVSEGPPHPPSSKAPWLFVGRISEEKGILPLLRMWPSEVPLRVVGAGPQLEAATVAAAGKRIEFTGHLTPAQVASELNSARALVFPSVWREIAAAMSYVEAMAAGRPTLAIGESAVSEDLREGGGGLVIDNLGRLKEGINAMNSSLEEFSLAAHRRYVARFTESTWVRSMEEIYESA